MKVHNTKLKMSSFYSVLKNAFTELAPEVVELMDSDAVQITTRQPDWDARYRSDSKLIAGGVDVCVQPDPVNYSYNNSEDKIRFGVRTNADGEIDLGKLAGKFMSRIDEIKKSVERHGRNIRIREEKIQKRRANGEVLDRLKEEGVIDNIFEYDEKSTGFETSILLKDEIEVRAFAAFKKQLLACREVNA